ncbi:hypothetical protein QAD02_003868 [Eretmocerus hayati]|uniref:Uncharacterized protein n=1 Tax=Eretmocerus hayati TaxID=131215 RepID=A0ACC2NMW2_9HYME|nr:hypothetical protein QAD02_003868 [Eretmocerus hayati]
MLLETRRGRAITNGAGRVPKDFIGTVKELTEKFKYRIPLLTLEDFDRFDGELSNPKLTLEHHLVVLALGLSGCCRMHELIELLMNQVVILENCLIITIPKNKTKNGLEKIFRVVGSFFELVQRYLAARASLDHPRFLMSYRSSCGFINVPAGKVTIRTVPTVVAEFLGLPSFHEYTGHCVRRSAATIYASTGVTDIDLMQFGKWQTMKSAQIYNVDTDHNRNKVSHIVTNIIMTEPTSNVSRTPARTSSFPRPASTSSRPKIISVDNLQQSDVRYFRASTVHPLKKTVTSIVTSGASDHEQESVITSHDQSDSTLPDVSSSAVGDVLVARVSVLPPTVPIVSGLQALRAGKYQYKPYETLPLVSSTKAAGASLVTSEKASVVVTESSRALPLVSSTKTAETPLVPIEKASVMVTQSSSINVSSTPLPSSNSKSVCKSSVASSSSHGQKCNGSNEVPQKDSHSSHKIDRPKYHGTVYRYMTPSPPDFNHNSLVPRNIPVSCKRPLCRITDDYEASIVHDVDDSYHLADISAELFEDFSGEPTTSDNQQPPCIVEHQFEALLNETDREEDFDSQGATMDDGSVVKSLSEECSNYNQVPMNVLEEPKNESIDMEPESILQQAHHEVGDRSSMRNPVSLHEHSTGSGSSERIASDEESVPDDAPGQVIRLGRTTLNFIRCSNIDIHFHNNE